mmetsp:Transcript_29768/g.64413  ORF Transcript_29768/g.64413 Transcript_29768/m.64413 type:complete len:335 (+) Transcript_29768:659-1663(+)
MPQLSRHLACPDDGHTNALPMESEGLAVVEAQRLCTTVESVHESLHSVPQSVGILKEESSVLFEGVRVSQEHRLCRNHLLVDHRQEAYNLGPGRVRKLGVEGAPQGIQDAAALTQKRQGFLPLLLGREIGCGGRSRRKPSQRGTCLHGCLLLRLGLLQEMDQLFKASSGVNNFREVTGKLGAAQNVVEVLLSDASVGLPKHAHRLGCFTDGCMYTAKGKGQEDFADAEDQLRQVECAQDILGKNLAIYHKAERLLGRSGGVVVVHQGRGHFHEVCTSQSCNHAHGVSIHSTTDCDDHRPSASLLGFCDAFQKLLLSIGFVAFEALPRGVGKVVA